MSFARSPKPLPPSACQPASAPGGAIACARHARLYMCTPAELQRARSLARSVRPAGRDDGRLDDLHKALRVRRVGTQGDGAEDGANCGPLAVDDARRGVALRPTAHPQRSRHDLRRQSSGLGLARHTLSPASSCCCHARLWPQRERPGCHPDTSTEPPCGTSHPTPMHTAIQIPRAMPRA